jgi:putative endopeptidase
VAEPGKPPPADKIPPPPTSPIPQSLGEPASPPPVPKEEPPFDTTNMDPSVKPSDDFFLYANGGWIKRTPIPPEYSRWGSFNQLIEKNNDALHDVAERAAKDTAAPDPDVKKVGDYYASGMDEASIQVARAKPLTDELKRIDAVKTREDVLREIAHLHEVGVGSLFGFSSGQDDKNSTMVIAQAYQDGLGMPDRDYYTKTD